MAGSSFRQHLPSLQVPGGDLAGDVVEGDEGGTFKPGDRVFACVDGWRPEVAWGTYAELCSVPAAHLARIPEGVSYTDAAALCLTGEESGWRVLLVAGGSSGLPTWPLPSGDPPPSQPIINFTYVFGHVNGD